MGDTELESVTSTIG